MKFIASFFAILAAFSPALAVEFTNTGFDVAAGKPFTLSWADAKGAVTITLKNGPNSNLKDVLTITSGQTGTSFTWTPPSSLPSDTYAFEIIDTTNVPNYSQQFSFQGGASASATSVSLTSSSASSTKTGSSSESSSSSATTKSSSITAASSSSSSTSAVASASSAHNSTMTTRASTSASSTSSSTSTSSSNPQNSNDGKQLGSPLAFLFVTVAALMIFN